MAEISPSERFLKLNTPILQNNHEKIYKAKDLTDSSIVNTYWHEIQSISITKKEYEQKKSFITSIEEWQLENGTDILKRLILYYITNTPDLLTDNPLFEHLINTIDQE